MPLVHKASMSLLGQRAKETKTEYQIDALSVALCYQSVFWRGGADGELSAPEHGCVLFPVTGT
jgi:hypothetical protein